MTAPSNPAPSTMEVSQPPTGANMTQPPTGVDTTSAPTGTGMTQAPTGATANTSATVPASGDQVIASQPVPDTRANRAKYGQPLSRAGKHSAPAGN
jgi:hypothetical protein